MNPWVVRNFIFPLHEKILGRDTLKCLSELEQTQWYSRAEIYKYQFEKLKKLLNHCYENVPYYKRIFKENKITPDFIKDFDDLNLLPFLTKKIIKENREELIAQNFKRRLFKMNTGGSTGEPLIFFVDKKRIVYDKASNLRSKKWWGIDIGDKEIVLWGSPIEIKGQDRFKTIRDYLFNTKLLSAFDMSKESMSVYSEIFKRYKPKHLFGYPSSIYLFAKFLNENKINLIGLKLKVIFVTAELLFDFQKEYIEETFNCPVANGYGGRDGGFISHQCPNGSMHITENIFIEIIRDTESLSTGVGEIVITHLDSYGMPFIRYKMGDTGALSDKKCSCGRELSIIENIHGRITDFIITPDGRSMHGLSLIYILRDIEGIEKFKIIQKRKDFLEIQLIKNIHFSYSTEEAIISRTQDRLGKDVTVSLKYVDMIEPDKSGKYRYIVSEIGAIN